jgi:4-hydroxy-2-oxoheptanedioate aldolase
MKTNDPALIEIVGLAGFDFVIIDLEHGPTSTRVLQDLVRAAELRGVLPVVRVKEGVPSTIGEALDLGACGIQVPQISTPEEAGGVVERMKFAPEGSRGVCRFVRSAGYSAVDRYTYFKESNEALVILQLEGTEAIENLEGILSVEGVDILFVGPYDLSQALGIPGQIDHPRVLDKVRQISEACQAKGRCVGIFADTVESSTQWRRLGIRYIAYSVDVGIFYESCRDLVQSIKGKEVGGTP